MSFPLIRYFKNSIGSHIRQYIPGTFENIKNRKRDILKKYINKERSAGLYVSMTTFEPRLKVFEYTVLSILAGTVLPEKILIYVPRGFRNLVERNDDSWLKYELGKGLVEMIEMEVDLGCHSKYFYSFQQYGGAKDILICDDDVVYYENWLKDLLHAMRHREYDVFAFKAVQVKVVNNTIQPYDSWTHCSFRSRGENELLYAEGVGGVLYRKNSINKEVLNKDKFLELAPKADDVWLWFCTYLNSCRIKYVVPTNTKKLLYVIPGSQDTNLWVENTLNKRNDIFVKKCHTYFLEQYNLDLTRY
ncbi:hypothetical protein FAZ19_23085 [Sphingobacterium alkalisoli]|uniref:Glycosyltransferase family 2 protein n=1 Tax=Sphingobacterium alkalisoli TaxID=1874115 RepID=A0A4V5LWV8_9SPHI|nr:hypothetical protein [Sphingobacterium alkalisoli]TJY60139.1 hypothetical protein FAZ19_23085 [Sphingobacterium alkalisoli]GGH32160.1 glycosyl transferase [Sphingobacterium alkalisoli]